MLERLLKMLEGLLKMFGSIFKEIDPLSFPMSNFLIS